MRDFLASRRDATLAFEGFLLRVSRLIIVASEFVLPRRSFRTIF